jgi:hypothetical protein
MMKWIVGLLLLANLLLFGWMRWGNKLTVDVDAATAQAALNPDKIKLLETLAASAAMPASATAAGMALPASASVATSSPVVPVSAPLVAAIAPTKALNCAEWGEFSGDDLTHAQQALAELKLGNRLTQRSVERNHGYWVYIPPLKKRAEVENKIAQLKERGVNDYFVVQEKGPWLNAISLGVFKTEEAAQKYLVLLHSNGVRSAKLGERMSKLKFTVFILKGLEAQTVGKLNTLQKGFPDSELKVSACGN